MICADCGHSYMGAIAISFKQQSECKMGHTAPFLFILCYFIAGFSETTLKTLKNVKKKIIKQENKSIVILYLLFLFATRNLFNNFRGLSTSVWNMFVGICAY